MSTVTGINTFSLSLPERRMTVVSWETCAAGVVEQLYDVIQRISAP